MSRMVRTVVLTGEVLDERPRYSLGELCRACSVHAELVLEMVGEGIIEPVGGGGADAPHTWRFTGQAVERVHLALRLQRDLGVNLAGAALAIELLEELRMLRRRLSQEGWA